MSRRPFEIQYSLLSDLPPRRPTPPAPQPPAQPPPLATNDELPWTKHVQQAKEPPKPRPALRWGARWRDLLRAERWLDEGDIEQRALYVRMVRALDLREGVIEATVVPAKAKPHRVQVRVTSFTPSEWARLARQVVDDGEAERVVDGLERKEVPLSLLDAADRHRLRLLPRRLATLASACTCGGARAPCGHVLALHLGFSERLDADPRLLLSLRGGTPELVTRLVSRVNEEADIHEAAGSTADDPFLAPDAPEPDWELLARAPAARAPLPALEGWRGRETFDAVVRRLLSGVRG